MFRLSKIAQYVASAKAAVSSRGAATTQQNLETINASILKLTATVAAWTGGILSAAGISSDQARLGQDMKNCIADATASEVVSEEEAVAIMFYIREHLDPNIRAAMLVLKMKKTLLAAVGLASTVLADMHDLRELTNALGVAFLSKTPVTQLGEGTALMKGVDDAFEDAIKFYAS
jgi:hypothetical protein